MNQKVLFEIPIYSMSKKKFDKLWEKVTNKQYDSFIEHGHSEESARELTESLCYPKRLWEYNQIVGYIKISVTAKDVFFDVFCSLDRRYGDLHRYKPDEGEMNTKSHS